MTRAIADRKKLEGARIAQATVLGEDLLVTFANGASALLPAEQVRQLALASAKVLMTEEEADRLPLPRPDLE